MLRAADPRVSQWRGNQEIHKSPFKQDINKTEGQGEGTSGEEREEEIVHHHQCFLEQPLSDMLSETKWTK